MGHFWESARVSGPGVSFSSKPVRRQVSIVYEECYLSFFSTPSRFRHSRLKYAPPPPLPPPLKVGLVYAGKDGHGAEARLATAAQSRTPRCVGCFVAEGSHVNVEDVGVDLFHMDPTSGGDGR